MAQQLVAEHGGEVPADMDLLTTLPGVGRKTANVVLGHALGVPGLPVDRHVLRVSNRIGIAEGDDPVKVEAQLCAALPEGDVDARLRRADPPRAAHLPAEAAVRSVLGPRRLRLLPARGRSRTWPSRRQGRARPSGGSRMTREKFERLVAEAVTLIPKRFRREMKNLALVVEDEPSAELLEEMEIEPPDSLYGLYQGTPLPERAWGYGNTLPDRVTLFQKPIEEDCEDEDEVRAVIGETLIHEVGHYFGLSEEEIEEIEERYWRGEMTRGKAHEDGGSRKREAGMQNAKAAAAEAIRPALPRGGVGREAHRRHCRDARRHVSRDRPRPRRADRPARGARGPRHRRRDRSRSRRALADRPAAPERARHRVRLPRDRSRGRCCATSVSPVRVVGNLPYNVSSPILFAAARCRRRGADLFRDATLMLQKEVADRLVATPGRKEYGVLAIQVALVGRRRAGADAAARARSGRRRR